MTRGRNEFVAPDTGAWRRMLTARPVHNQAARVVESEGDAVTVYVRTIRPWYMVPPLSWIVPNRPERKAVLDRLGSQVWRACDGDRTVEAVIDAFAAEHGLTFHEARGAVTTYLKSLVKRSVLAMAITEEPAA